MKKILCLVGFNGFQPIEYSVPKEMLESAGFLLETVSDKKGFAKAAVGDIEVEITKTLEECSMGDFEAIMLVGGEGALESLENNETVRLLNEALIADKLIAAICISPRILARAHILHGKMATGWNGDESLPQIFEENGVIFEDAPVVVDGNFITANGPKAAEEYGKAILEALK